MRLGGALRLDSFMFIGSEVDTTNGGIPSVDLGYSFEGFYWRPWFARFNFGANIFASDSYGDAGATDGVTNATFGLNAFPQSRFPLSLNASFSERHEGQVPLNNVTNESYTFSLRQAYTPLRPGERHIFYFRHNYGTSPSDIGPDTESFKDNLTYALSKVFLNRQSVDFNVYINREENQPEDFVETTLVADLAHRIDPHPHVSISSNAFAISDSDELKGRSSTVASLSASSSLRWNPPGRQSGGGSIRADYIETSDDSDHTATTAVLSNSLDYNYVISPETRLDVNAFTSWRDYSVTGRDELTATQTAVLDYRPRAFRWGRLDVNWSASGGLRNFFEDSASASRNEQSVFTTASESFNWSAWKTQFWSGGWNHSAGVSHLTNSKNGTDVIFNTNNSISASRNILVRAGRALVNGNITDNRRYVLVENDDPNRIGTREDRSTQNASLTATYATRLDHTSSLTADLSINASASELGFLDNDYTLGSRAVINYTKRSLWRIPGLDLHSVLSLSSDGLLPAYSDERDTLVVLDNTIVYEIGRLEVELKANFSYIQPRWLGDLRLNLIRRFGR